MKLGERLHKTSLLFMAWKGSIALEPIKRVYSQTWVNDHLWTTTTCLQRPPFWGPIFTFYNIKLPLNNDHLSITATNLGSRGWSLYTGLTVHRKTMKCHQATNNKQKTSKNSQFRYSRVNMSMKHNSLKIKGKLSLRKKLFFIVLKLNLWHSFFFFSDSLPFFKVHRSKGITLFNVDVEPSKNKLDCSRNKNIFIFLYLLSGNTIPQ